MRKERGGSEGDVGVRVLVGVLVSVDAWSSRVGVLAEDSPWALNPRRGDPESLTEGARDGVPCGDKAVIKGVGGGEGGRGEGVSGIHIMEGLAP